MTFMISRDSYLNEIERGLASNRVVSLLGPRQCGKTTLARNFIRTVDGPTASFDLEDPRDLARLAEPMLALEGLEGLVVIDEIQRKPELFQTIRVLADRDPLPAKFLILGSASPEIVKGVSESLAGRVHFVDISGFSLDEVGYDNQQDLWLRGGFPEAFLKKSDELAFKWLDDFIATFLERDLPQLGIRIPSEQLRRFWTMLSHYQGSAWNASEISRSLGLSNKTIRHYVDILSGAFMVRLLPPWFENLGKRIVKSPKAYIRDTGILHALLGMQAFSDLQSHPKLGASWEGFALETIIRSNKAERNAYFWATHAGAELDLLILRKGQRYGFEFKYADAPRLTKSMAIAIEDLRLERLYVVHPTGKRYPLSDKVEALSLPEAINALKDR